MTPASTSNLLIIGASTRAAAFSALRAGLRPTCFDLFADRDLEARCRVVRIPPDKYPHGFLQAVEKEPPTPWMFTGGLENRQELVEQIAAKRPLWGIGRDALVQMRDPGIFYSMAVPCPAICCTHHCETPRGLWLLKPRLGSGGIGIRFWGGSKPTLALLKTHYLQQYIEGTPAAAIYLGDGCRSRLLGVTRQLVGETFLHAGPFQYCGSIGPLPLGAELESALERLGDLLAARCKLRGLFGVDFILRDGVPWPVEINPRYTASVEVLEYGGGVPAIAQHRAAFEPTAEPENARPRPPGMVGKAILVAREALTFPESGPWSKSLDSPGLIQDMPDFADIPHPGERIEARRPILTFFTRADTETECLERLKGIAAELDSLLYRS
jgi:predicted ATP-grasp superfamily ATP-dependent carboligase